MHAFYNEVISLQNFSLIEHKKGFNAKGEFFV